MEHSPFWEAKGSLPSWEIPHILRNPNVQYHDHNSLPLISMSSQMYPADTIPPYFFRAYFSIILQFMPRFSKQSSSFRFSHQNPEPISLVSHPRHMPCSSHPLSFDPLQNLILWGVQNKKPFTNGLHHRCTWAWNPNRDSLTTFINNKSLIDDINEHIIISLTPWGDILSNLVHGDKLHSNV